MRTLPDPFGIPGPSFMPSLSARTIPKFYPPDFEPAWKYGPKPFRSEAGVLCAPAKWQRTAPRLRKSSGGAQPARRKIVSFGLLGGRTPKFYHNPPGRTIPNRVSERTEGHGRLQFHRAVVLFYHRTHRIRLRRTQKEVGERCRPDASTTTLSQRTRSVASARLPTCPFLTQKWYRPGARCTRAALGAWRTSAGGLQHVATEGEIHGYRRQIEDTQRRGRNKLRLSRQHTPVSRRRAAGRCRAQAARDSTLPRPYGRVLERRKPPSLLYRLDGTLLNRLDEVQLPELLPQLPPRSTRAEPEAEPLGSFP